MIPALAGSAADAVAAAQRFAELGVLAPAIRPPAVATSRLRFASMATHTDEQIQQVCDAIAQVAR